MRMVLVMMAIDEDGEKGEDDEDDNDENGENNYKDDYDDDLPKRDESMLKAQPLERGGAAQREH